MDVQLAQLLHTGIMQRENQFHQQFYYINNYICYVNLYKAESMMTLEISFNLNICISILYQL